MAKLSDTQNYSGPTTTAHSVAEGRMKIGLAKKKLLKSKIKSYAQG